MSELTSQQLLGIGIAFIAILGLVAVYNMRQQEQQRQSRFTMQPTKRRNRQGVPLFWVLAIGVAVAVFGFGRNPLDLITPTFPTDTPTPAATVPRISIAATPLPTRTATATPTVTVTPTITPTPFPTTRPDFAPDVALPPTFRQITPEAPPEASTRLRNLQFSEQITSGYSPIDPATAFANNPIEIHATFEHTDLVTGVSWAWVWSRDGEVMAGGNELWQYGREGIGFVRLAIGEPLPDGQYALSIWINGSPYVQGEFTIGDVVVEPPFQELEAPADLAADDGDVITATVPAITSRINNIQFSTSINDFYEPINPGRSFSASNPIIYATFQHVDMVDNAPWAWVWRLDGIPRDSDSQIWTYGPDGNGFVTLNANEGLQVGFYTLEITHNGAVIAESQFEIVP